MSKYAVGMCVENMLTIKIIEADSRSASMIKAMKEQIYDVPDNIGIAELYDHAWKKYGLIIQSKEIEREGG